MCKLLSFNNLFWLVNLLTDRLKTKNSMSTCSKNYVFIIIKTTNAT